MPKFKVGDVIYSPNGDIYSPGKILGVDYYKAKADSVLRYHVLLYKPVSSVPKEAAISDFQVSIMHAPLPVDGVDKDSHLITNIPVTDEELEGYHEFLRRTDFNLYLEVTGQNLEKVIDEAYNHLRAGRAAHEEMKLDQAIEHYILAHETLPVYSAAFVHKGFAYMDLGRFEDAIEAFQESLRIDQNEKAAWCSIGECLLELGKPNEALPYFETGAERWQEVTVFRNLLTKTKTLIV